MDDLAPMPATAVAWRVPDPISDIHDFMSAVVLADVLGGGEASRLYQRLVKTERLAADVGAAMGAFGDPFEMRDPTSLQVLAWHPGVSADDVLESIEVEVREVARGVTTEEVDRVVASIVSDHLRQLDNVLQRGMEIGMLEQQRGRAELVNEFPVLLGDVTADSVSETADRWLVQTGRAVLEVIPGDTK